MGLSPQQARSALGALAQTTATNYRRDGAAASVTGPIPRGDAETVGRQMEALRSRLPSLEPLAKQLALRSLSFAPVEDRPRFADALFSVLNTSDQGDRVPLATPDDSEKQLRAR